MALSDEIMAQIQAKQKLKLELLGTRKEVQSWGKTTGCLANTFSKAGDLLTDSVSVGGGPVDNGRTSEMGHDFKSLTSDIEALAGDILGKISDLDGEIAELYMAYNAAVEAEKIAKEAEEAAERAANKKNNKKK